MLLITTQQSVGSTALWQLVFQSYWLLVFLTRQTLTEGGGKAKKSDTTGTNRRIPTWEK